MLMLKVMKTQQGWASTRGGRAYFTEAGGREIVGILHVSSDNVELEYER